MDRLEAVRQVVDAILRQQPDPEERRCGFVHLYGVSATCALLAVKRGQDVELCAVAGMLHDIWTYKTGDPANHAHLSAREAEQVLDGLGGFRPDEIAAVSGAIARHSDKANRDSQVAELLKDADILQHYLYNPALASKGPAAERLERVLGELSLDASPARCCSQHCDTKSGSQRGEGS
jgi:uncharacterized protein